MVQKEGFSYFLQPIRVSGRRFFEWPNNVSAPANTRRITTTRLTFVIDLEQDKHIELDEVFLMPAHAAQFLNKDTLPTQDTLSTPTLHVSGLGWFPVHHPTYSTWQKSWNWQVP